MCTLKLSSPQPKGGHRSKACFPNSVSWSFSFAKWNSFKQRKNSFLLTLPCGLAQLQRGAGSLNP